MAKKIRVRDDRTLDWLVSNFGGADLHMRGGKACPPLKFSKGKWKAKSKKVKNVRPAQVVEVVRYSFSELSNQKISYEKYKNQCGA